MQTQLTQTGQSEAALSESDTLGKTSLEYEVPVYLSTSYFTVAEKEQSRNKEQESRSRRAGAVETGWQLAREH